jgi:hypothetical protein
LRASLEISDDIWTAELPVVFDINKDRPILFSSLAWADILLTLDRADFERLLGDQFYGLPILRPGAFLKWMRQTSQLV